MMLTAYGSVFSLKCTSHCTSPYCGTVPLVNTLRISDNIYSPRDITGESGWL